MENLLKEIEYVKSRYTMNFVKFGDDCFALRSDEWLMQFAEEYPKRIGIPFNCFLRLDTVTEDLIQTLKRAGCHSVHLSLDSASQTVREKVLGRNFRNIDVVATLKLFDQYGIKTWLNFMLAAPDSTFEDDLESIKICRSVHVSYPAYSTTVPMEGTTLYQDCLVRGLIDPATHHSDMAGCSQESGLLCFTKKDKRRRYNIYLLGAAVSKLPSPFYQLGMFAIKHIPPNPLFHLIRDKLYTHYIENVIFALHVEPK